MTLIPSSDDPRIRYVIRTAGGEYVGPEGNVALPADAIHFPNRFAALMLMGQIGYTMHMARIDAWTLPETAPEPRGRN